jgi:hypothetical protein
VSRINLDMIARGGAQNEPKGAPGYLQVIGSRRLSTELGDLVEPVNREGNHYSYARYGAPIAFSAPAVTGIITRLPTSPRIWTTSGLPVSPASSSRGALPPVAD